MLEVFETIGRAISDQTRIRILKMLQPGELCVCQITAILGLAPATVSKHLSLLKIAGLLSQRKRGRWVYYRLSTQSINDYAPNVLSMIGGILADDKTITEDRHRLERVNLMSLEELCGKGRFVFVGEPFDDPRKTVSA